MFRHVERLKEFYVKTEDFLTFLKRINEWKNLLWYRLNIFQEASLLCHAG